MKASFLFFCVLSAVLLNDCLAGERTFDNLDLPIKILNGGWCLAGLNFCKSLAFYSPTLS